MFYINIQTGQYPLSQHEIKQAHPETSFSNIFSAPDGYALVELVTPPTCDPIYQYVREVAPVLVAGNWTQQWEVVPLDADTIAANQAAKAITDREAAKQARAAAVEAITVTTAAGNVFDGDETSQTRMARAVLVLSTGAAASVPWVLSDNSVIQADAAELTEALALAGAAQAALWVV